MWRAAVALTALVLGAPAIACGDEDDGGSGDEALSDERQEYVDAVGIDAFHAAEVTPEDLSELDGSLDDLGIAFADAQVDAFWNDLNQCMNVRAFFFEALAADGDFADATVDCLHDSMDNNLIKRFMAGAVAEGQDAFEEHDQLTGDLADAFSECGVGKAGELTRVTRRL